MLTPDPAGNRVVDVLCAMCRDILETAVVTPADDIFDLDPDSLSLERLNARIRETWGVTVPNDVFFDTESIAELASVVDSMRAKV